MDPMDDYSKPVRVEERKLGTLFFMKSRKNPDKPGRELVVTHDDRFPLVEGFRSHYSYFVRFLEAGNTAGNHYHKEKHELFVPIVGEFTVRLEDPESKEQETLTLRTEDYAVFYVRPGISHAVTSKEKGGVLLVIATSPNSEEDEYPYEIK